jgi:hypothetical protein
MPTSQRLCQLCIIAGPLAKAGRLRVAAFHHPALRQQPKALLGLGQLDHCQVPMVGLRLLRGLCPPSRRIGIWGSPSLWVNGPTRSPKPWCTIPSDVSGRGICP